MKDITEKLNGEKEYILELKDGAELGVVKSIKDVSDVIVGKLPQLEKYSDFKVILKHDDDEDVVFDVSVVFEQAEFDLDKMVAMNDNQWSSVFFAK